MGRTPTLAATKRVTANVETALHQQAVARAREYGFSGGFSEYVSRLLVADMNRKRGIAHLTPRKFKTAQPN